MNSTSHPASPASPGSVSDKSNASSTTTPAGTSPTRVIDDIHSDPDLLNRANHWEETASLVASASAKIQSDLDDARAEVSRLKKELARSGENVGQPSCICAQEMARLQDENAWLRSTCERTQSHANALFHNLEESKAAQDELRRENQYLVAVVKRAKMNP